jgi:hypothetical protein
MVMHYKRKLYTTVCIVWELCTCNNGANSVQQNL